MTNNAQLIKTALMLKLAQEGKTLQEFENELSSGKIEKQAAGNIANALTAFLNLGGGSAIAAGSGAGLGAYAAYRANEDSTERQLKKLEEEQQYREAARALQEKLRLNQVM